MEKFSLTVEEDRRATEGRIVMLHFVPGSPEHEQYSQPEKRDKCLHCKKEEWMMKVCGYCHTAR